MLAALFRHATEPESIKFRLLTPAESGWEIAGIWFRRERETSESRTNAVTSFRVSCLRTNRQSVERLPIGSLTNYGPASQTRLPCSVNERPKMKSVAITLLALCPLLGLIGCSDSTTDTEASSASTDAGANSQPAEEEAVDRSNQVLRHAVFFSFKEDSSAEDIQAVADAFAALPSKIDSIIDFSWGTNNSPEEHDDGFTHCFLLTFKDEAGRAIYLPHADHKAFGDVLRPHMKDVFVIDWWGSAEPAMPEKALQHVVFFKFKDDAAADGIRAVESAFAELPTKIDPIKRFEWGTNNSPEKHDDEFTHAFLVTFEGDADRAKYLPHPDHMAFVKVLEPVLDKVRVLDFTASE